MSDTLQLTKIAPQLWEPKHDQVIPELQSLPKGIQSISKADVAIEPLPFAFATQTLYAILSALQVKEINTTIGMFPTSVPTKAELDKGILLSPLYFVAVDHINVDGNTLRLMEPITANVTYQDSMYFCQNEDLGIVSMSAKLEDCVRSFQEEVVFLFNEYGKEDDDRLTKDARELKRKILHYINK
jgi:hypothetical protein